MSEHQPLAESATHSTQPAEHTDVAAKAASDAPPALVQGVPVAQAPYPGQPMAYGPPGYPPPGMHVPPPGGYAPPPGRYGPAPGMYGGQQLTYITMQDPVGDQSECLGAGVATAACGVFGVIAQWLMCRTAYGNYGSAVGCIVSGIISIGLVSLWMGLAMHRDSFYVDTLSYGRCSSYGGSWAGGSCQLSSCPYGYDASYEGGRQVCKEDALSVVAIVFYGVRIVIAVIITICAVFWAAKAKRRLQTLLSNRGQPLYESA